MTIFQQSTSLLLLAALVSLVGAQQIEQWPPSTQQTANVQSATVYPSSYAANGYTTETAVPWSSTSSCPFTRPVNGNAINIPPKYMWGWSTAGIQIVGYCGENAMQSAAEYYGNYFSQELVFRASGQTTTLTGGGGTIAGQQLLLGRNDDLVAAGLSLNYEQFDNTKATPQSTAFLAWVKTNIDLNRPVISGWFDPTLSDKDYDHIMPVVGYDSATPGGPITTLYYNSLLYLHTNKQTSFVQTREQCKATSGYKGAEYCLPSVTNYGITIMGNKYPGQYFAQLSVPFANEPDWGAVDGYYYKYNLNVGNGKPISDPISFNANLNVYGLTAGQKYSCVRYDTVASLPVNCNFLFGPYAARYDFTAAAAVSVVAVTGLMSNGSYMFRCMANSATPLTTCPSQPPIPSSFCKSSTSLSAALTVTPGLSFFFILILYLVL